MKVKDFFQKHLGDLITGVVLVSLSCGLMAYYLWPREVTGDLYAFVRHDGELVIDPIVLSGVDQEYTVSLPDDGVSMVIARENHKVRVKSSNCYGQECVRMGAIQTSMQEILCVPNHVSITITTLGNDDISVVPI